jgi:hypothetical protein
MSTPQNILQSDSWATGVSKEQVDAAYARLSQFPSPFTAEYHEAEEEFQRLLADFTGYKWLYNLRASV